MSSPCEEDGFTEEQSTLKAVRTRTNPGELTLPEKSRREESLQKKGYSPFWTRGLNEVNKWLALKEQFIRLKANPHITHIDYFADQIPTHIEFIKTAMTSLPHRSERQKALEHLEKKAKEAINNRKVTYEWWIKFNHNLSKILSDSYSQIFPDKAPIDEASMLIDSLISLFPGKVLMPTTQGGLGIITLNRIHPLNIHPLGLIKTDQLTHNRTVSPEGFFLHDIGHANRSDHFSSPTHKKFHDLLMEKIEGLPTEKRQNVELIYFVLIHELNIDFIAQSLHTLPSYITQLDSIINIYYRDFNSFIHLPSSYRQVRGEVEKAAHDFKEVFSQIREEITE